MPHQHQTFSFLPFSGKKTLNLEQGKVISGTNAGNPITTSHMARAGHPDSRAWINTGDPIIDLDFALIPCLERENGKASDRIHVCYSTKLYYI